MKPLMASLFRSTFMALCMASPLAASALCAGQPEDGRWRNNDAAGSPFIIEVRPGNCEVEEGNESKVRMKMFVKQSSGSLYGRPVVTAKYRVSKGVRWLYARVPTGGYVDNIWARVVDRNGKKELYVFIRHESLDQKPSAESKLWFQRA